MKLLYEITRNYSCIFRIINVLKLICEVRRRILNAHNNNESTSKDEK